jgi:calcineurin-like phosphoesterase family protein
MNTFFTADTHLGHSAIIRFCSRPFLNVEEMNEIIIKNWNFKVKPKDRVYIIGDFAFGSREKILNYTQRLNGHIILIVGNHDEIGQPVNYGFSEKHQLLDIKINGKFITMCHYAMRTWNKSHFDSWHIFGHSHGTLDKDWGKCWDVGVDNNNFAPLEFEELKKIMDLQPHNLNWLERLKGFDQKEFDEVKKTEME